MPNVLPCKNLDGYGPTPLEPGELLDPSYIDLAGLAPVVHSHASDSWFTTPMALKADLVGGVVPTSQIPAQAITDVFVVASQAAMLALAAQRGDVAIRSDTGKTFILATDSPTTLADWKELPAIGTVASVNGQQGVVVLGKADVELANVDNTSDANKPVSSAQASAIGAKENTIAAGTTAQYWRGDKTWQTHDKASVGLGSVDNTADTAKPVSTAQQTALDGKVPLPLATLIAPTTGNVQTFTTTRADHFIALDHTSAIAAQTFAFPADADSRLNQELRIFSRSIVTTVTLSLNGNTIIGNALTTLPANGNAAWRKAGANQWRRTQ